MSEPEFEMHWFYPWIGLLWVGSEF